MLFKPTDNTPIKAIAGSEIQQDDELRITQMYTMLRALSEWRIPDEKYAKEDLQLFVKTLLESRTYAPTCWNLAGSLQVPNDVRIYKIHLPTHIAVAILSLVWVDFNDIIEDQESFLNIYLAALDSSADFGFWGESYDSVPDMLEIMKILEMGQVISLVIKMKDKPSAQKYLKSLMQIQTFVDEKLKSGKTQAGWAQKDYRNAYIQVNQLLKVI